MRAACPSLLRRAMLRPWIVRPKNTGTAGRTTLCTDSGARRFRPWRLAERIHRNRRVFDVEDLEMLGLVGRAEHDAIARARLHQRARERRHPTDVAAVDVDLVDADDADQLFP